MGVRHHEQETGLPSKLGFLIVFARGLIITACTLCKYRLIVCCMNTNETLVFRLKTNHVWSSLSSFVQFLGAILVVAKQ
jgi:hypothetical protein